MNLKSLSILAVASCCFLLNPSEHIEAQATDNYLDDIMPAALKHRHTLTTTDFELMQIKIMLLKQAHQLSSGAINKILTILGCAANQAYDQNMLTIIDYSLPSNQKRLWIFDLHQKQLLFNTYVSHGIRSGVFSSNYFSNQYNSKATSIGVYKTDKPYYGRHGLSLRLDGLEYGFNDHADGRAIVMHGGWYVTERFINKYGRAGRSWGCPAVSSDLNQPIIDTIKEHSLFIAYYPSDRWLLKSRFLNCHFRPLVSQIRTLDPLISEIEQRDEILFVNKHEYHQMTDSTPVIVLSADAYQRVFHLLPPLTRMLRRQINQMEYIALNNRELHSLMFNHDENPTDDDKKIYAVTARIKMVRGYYATEMDLVELGHVTNIRPNEQHQSFTVFFATKPAIEIRSTDQFVRWIGL